MNKKEEHKKVERYFTEIINRNNQTDRAKKSISKSFLFFNSLDKNKKVNKKEGE